MNQHGPDCGVNVNLLFHVSGRETIRIVGKLGGDSGYRWTFLAGKVRATGNQSFPRHIRNLALFAASTADRDDQDTTIRCESLAGSPQA